MPQKIPQLKASLQKAGFILIKKRGKGSHAIPLFFLEKMEMTSIGIKKKM